MLPTFISILWFQVTETQLKLTQAGRKCRDSRNRNSVRASVSTLLCSSSACLNPSGSFKSRQPGTTATEGLLQFPRRKTLYKDADWPGLGTQLGCRRLWLAQLWGGSSNHWHPGSGGIGNSPFSSPLSHVDQCGEQQFPQKLGGCPGLLWPAGKFFNLCLPWYLTPIAIVLEF